MYTKEEIATLKGNIKKIEDYCLKTFVPKLRQMEHLSADFGDMVRYRPYDKPEKECSLSINADGSLAFRIGGLVLWFGVVPAHATSDRDLYKSWVYAEKLILNWNEAKRNLEHELAAKEATRRRIMTFEV